MVSIAGLGFGYRPGEPVIEDLTWEFQQGAVTAITGASGRGKSTLLYLIGLLIRPWSGRIILRDVDSRTMSDRERSALRATTVGFVFQDAALDATRTVLDNVCESALYQGMVRSEAVARAEILMDRFGVSLRADHRPGEVSGGQAQRVALCRALLTDPEVILADEPTGNLDAMSAAEVVNALRAAAHSGGGTVIIASHDRDVVAACDQVLAL
jgi:ABC-type lipoprotein export system ATPase subunit